MSAKHPLLLTAALLLPWAAQAGDNDAWQLTPRYEYSAVTINGRGSDWHTSGIALERQHDGRDAEFAAVERQQRGGLDDVAVQAGIRRSLGDWQAAARLRLTPDNDFLAKHDVELEADYPLSASLRAGLGYRHMDFRDSTVNLWAPQITYYRNDDEFGLTYKIGRNDTLDHDIRIAQLRAIRSFDRHQAGIYVSQGDYIFDALGITGGDGSGWSATAVYGYSFSPAATLRVELGSGAEADAFRQKTLGISLQYRPQ